MLVLALIYFISALPFFISGTIVSLVISDTIERVDRVYFFDLLGAAGGCLVLVPFLNAFGGPNTILVVGRAVCRLGRHLVQSRRIRHGAVRRRRSGARSGCSDPYNATMALIDVIRQRPEPHERAVRQVEQLFPHRPGDRAGLGQETSSSTPTRRPGSLISISIISRPIRRHDLAIRVPAFPTDPAPGRQDADHRSRRRLGRCPRPRIRQQGHHRRRNQSDHRDHDHAEASFPTTAIASISVPRCISSSKTAAVSSAAVDRKVSGDPGDAGRHLGLHRRRRVRAFRKQSLHHRRLPRLPDSPDRRRHPGLHALGF